MSDSPFSEDELSSVLSDAERQRSAKFAFPNLRRRYVTAHAALRCVLGGVLECPPADVAIVRDRNGKPGLSGHRNWFAFNLSHSDDFAAIALSDGCEVGIDIERQRPMPALSMLVDRHFTEIERRFFFAVEDGDRSRAFFRWWVAKESCLKALGVGLAFPLNGFSVDFRPDYRPRLLQAPRELEKVALAAFSTGEPDYQGMVAVNGAMPVEIAMQDWSWGAFHA